MDYRAANVTDMNLIPINHRDTVVQGDRCYLVTEKNWYTLGSDARTWVRDLTGAQLVYYPSGTADQTRLNALMANLGTATRRVRVEGGTFACDVDAVIPNNTTITFAPGVTITGTHVPFNLTSVTTTALGTMSSGNARFSDTIQSSAAAAVGATIGLELNSGTPSNDDLVRIPFTVLSCTGSSAPYALKLDRPVPIVLPSGTNIVTITARPTNIHIDAGNCAVQTSRHSSATYAIDCSIDNFVGTGASGLNLMIGCRHCTFSNITDAMALFFGACYDCHAYSCAFTDVAGPAGVMDDCDGCTMEKCRFLRSLNGGIMGTNRVNASGVDSGSYKCQYVQCTAIGNTTDGFSIQNACVECDCVDCETSGNAVGYEILAGWSGVGPVDCRLVRPHSADNTTNHFKLGSDGSTAARGTVIENAKFVGGTLTSEIGHSAKLSGGIHEGGVKVLAGTFNCEICGLDKIYSSGTWGISCDGNTVGSINIHDCPTIQSTGSTGAAITTGANNTIDIARCGLYANASDGYGITFASSGSTIKMHRVNVTAKYDSQGTGTLQMTQSGGAITVAFTTNRFLTFNEAQANSITLTGSLGANSVLGLPAFQGNRYTIINALTMNAKTFAVVSTAGGDTGVSLASGKTCVVGVNTTNNCVRLSADV